LIPVDLAFDVNLPARIATAVRGYRGWEGVDGIFTAHDRYFVVTAQAAEMLGLPAAPVISVLGHLSGTKDARRQMKSVPIHYPAIVKPISGFASEGVAKADSNAESLDSIASVNTPRHGDVVIVETYIDGLEFDANFVLWDV
ncbi:hypothetical protein K438DRAFT_1594730, partial [Mycena galopus ATCC 62051]